MRAGREARRRARRAAVAAALLIALAAAAVSIALTTGGSSHRPERVLARRPPAPKPAPTPPPPPPPAKGLAIGLTESNANLLWSSSGPPAAAPGFGPYRAALAALHPRYVRVLVDWAALQPSPNAPAALEQTADGCDRGLAPCGTFGGLHDELAAIASAQRGQSGFVPLIVLEGVPAWAALPPSGCERPGTGPFSRPIAPAAIAGYRALIREILALGRSVGLALPWWSPWNEPNHPAFISPQRRTCDGRSPALSPAVYTELARAMAAQLRADAPKDAMVIGELAGIDAPSPRAASVAEFVADLPADVICLGAVWSVHAYPRRGPANFAAGPVGELEGALDARGACGRRARIWVTETGAGAPHAGRARPPGVADERAGCRAMATALLRWYRDPRVDAAFQYSFREDNLFPVGLADATLTRLYPAYSLWLAWGGTRPAADPPPPLPAQCSRT